MTVSSRTSEGLPNRCPVCGKPVVMEPSLQGDGPCPHCGHLLWWFNRQLTDRFEVNSPITPKTSFVADLGADSLDVVELIMELEEEFDIAIPDEVAEKIQTVGDAIRYIQAAQSGKMND